MDKRSSVGTYCNGDFTNHVHLSVNRAFLQCTCMYFLFTLSFLLLKVPSNYELFLSFGPAVPDGYGLCYNPQKNKIIFGVSSVNSNPETNPGHFAAYLQRSLDEMQLLVTNARL